MPIEISDKYEVLQTLHQSAATAVYIIKHKTLGEIRILKSHVRDERKSSELLSEANLLSGLHFAGIPTIFDFYKDSTTDYLVEEYIEGTPLSEKLATDVAIEIDEAVDIICNVLEILEHLHSQEEPIIYRDLKPEHIMLSRGKIRLIDLGISVTKGKECEPKGTVGYAAPEQLRGDVPTESFDIYAAGRVLEELLDKVTAGEKDQYEDMVARATQDSPSLRYKSAREFREALSDRRIRINNYIAREEYLYRIAVVGSCVGAGCTHISIALTTFLNSMGMRTYYVDRSEERVLQNLALARPEMRIKDGVIYHNLFNGWIEYGPAVEPLTPPKGLYVYDCGLGEQIPTDADIVVFVISASPWKEAVVPDYVGRSNCICLANFATKPEALKIAKSLKKKVYRYPISGSPFSVEKATSEIFRKVCGWIK